MKRKITFLLLLSGLIGIACYTASDQKPSIAPNELTLLNIEALANGESSGRHQCYGIGSVDCGVRKVEFIIHGLSLE